MHIKVLGTGCANCKLLLERVSMVAKELHLDPIIDYITDLPSIGESGIMKTPGLIINDEIVSQGKVLAPSQLKDVLLAFKDE
jgi:small redox-active disulfide protein 2